MTPACTDETHIDYSCEETGLKGTVACNDGVLGECQRESPDAGVGRCSDDVQCDDGAFCNRVEKCLPESSLADDRGCAMGMFVPFCEDALDCTATPCSDALNRCIVEAPDAGGDGAFDINYCNGDNCGNDCSDALRPPRGPQP